ncbi:hypothetical protein A4E84_16360 [Streptomyces qaidamensis]|uniref:Uncharacterized protein n=1 Tax=Streptomyces qaidamensis TaxID=1783515 RepID=A0A143C0N3_9ACTN|nr:hypothetical protein A4E84_16360 [Streptomyces qaidamensis]
MVKRDQRAGDAFTGLVVVPDPGSHRQDPLGHPDRDALEVTVSARPVGGGWTVRAGQGQRETRIRVPAGGRADVNFTTPAGSSVPRRTDRRPAFRATADDHAEVPASVALIHRG